MPLVVWVLVLILHSSKAARLICDTESKSHFGGLAGLADLCPECQWPGLECVWGVEAWAGMLHIGLAPLTLAPSTL